MGEDARSKNEVVLAAIREMGALQSQVEAKFGKPVSLGEAFGMLAGMDTPPARLVMSDAGWTFGPNCPIL